MSDEVEHAIVFKVPKGFTVFLLRKSCHVFIFLYTRNTSALPFGLQEIEQILISKTIIVDSVSELSLDILDEIANDFEFVSVSLGLTRRNDVHVDFTGGWISCRLLECILDKHDGLVDISLLNYFREAHFCE